MVAPPLPRTRVAIMPCQFLFVSFAEQHKLVTKSSPFLSSLTHAWRYSFRNVT